jgi:hypothetical protein
MYPGDFEQLLLSILNTTGSSKCKSHLDENLASAQAQLSASISAGNPQSQQLLPILKAAKDGTVTIVKSCAHLMDVLDSKQTKELIEVSSKIMMNLSGSMM